MTFMPRAQAIELANQNNADDHERSYLISARGNYAVIEVYDENNEFLGVL